MQSDLLTRFSQLETLLIAHNDVPRRLDMRG